MTGETIGRLASVARLARQRNLDSLEINTIVMVGVLGEILVARQTPRETLPRLCYYANKT